MANVLFLTGSNRPKAEFKQYEFNATKLTLTTVRQTWCQRHAPVSFDV